MAETPSTMAPLGTSAPDFMLVDTTGQMVSLDDVASGSGFLVAFICNHCPFVKHLRHALADFGRHGSPSARGGALGASSSRGEGPGRPMRPVGR